MNYSRELLRARMAVRRNELDAKQRVAAAAGLMHSLENLPEFMTDTNVAGYWAVRGELPLNLAVASLARREQHYFLPVLGATRQLFFAEYSTGAAITHNRFGIPEPVAPADGRLSPQDMDVILLPLLAFDREGHRLGTGGGWYDSSLAFLRAGPRPAAPLLVGIGYAFQEVEAIPAEPWDVDLDYIATDSELIACGPVDATT
ncbi:MAG TPA: 5-formyltetrahydrofolate cyclo-ligase [Rhodanobacteraceae bacterium]|jgi:5-formyltetrahydrofolate cyclo-ligase|nr:5-formyltetrahydrofolate cyclo-ligase [Rhodanobacteraceae bacterium]